MVTGGFAVVEKLRMHVYTAYILYTYIYIHHTYIVQCQRSLCRKYLHALVGGGTCGQCKPSCLWGLLIRVAPFTYQEQPYIYIYICVCVLVTHVHICVRDDHDDCCSNFSSIVPASNLRHIVVAAAAARMAGLQNFHPQFLDKTLLSQVMDYLPVTPYLAIRAIKKSDRDRVSDFAERYPTGEPVNQIASANRCFNTAWRKIFGRYVRREISIVIQRIARKPYCVRSIVSLQQLHNVLGGFGDHGEEGWDSQEEASNSQEENEEEEVNSTNAQEEASNSQEEEEVEEEEAEEQPWVDVADAFEAWWNLGPATCHPPWARTCAICHLQRTPPP